MVDPIRSLLSGSHFSATLSRLDELVSRYSPQVLVEFGSYIAIRRRNRLAFVAVSRGTGGSRSVYSIGAVARMLGIPVATIRNWEERYETIVPERSAGGHRLYSRDQVEELRFIAEEVSRGISAADAHRLLADQSEEGQALTDESESGGPRLLVLLAERDPISADLAQFFLRTEGYEVQLALTAGEAESQWLEQRPELAVVELMISGGLGADLCRRLKMQGAGTVLAVSVLEARDEALAAGADAFLQKPFDPLELVSIVKDLLGASALVARRGRVGA